ncbi:hypothetical protein N7475_003423 [Penicillium sp. IBT 31633x]|nr:hypothetical protein N7475_003423 [Penicillium sp. IBT 31633x]
MPNAIRWTQEMDQKLLVAILATCPRLEYAAIAENLGNGATAEAVRQHIRLLKVRHEGGATASPTKDSPTKADKGKAKGTPRKRKHAAPAKADQNPTDDDQEEEIESTPTKQRKTSSAAPDQE